MDKLTHVKGNVLDTVFTNMTNKVGNVDVAVDVFSFCDLPDHRLVNFDIKLSFSNHPKLSSGVLNYAKANIEGMSHYSLDQHLFYASLKPNWITFSMVSL